MAKEVVTIKTEEEIKVMREGGKRLAAVLGEVVRMAKPGVSALELDRLAEGLIFSCGGEPVFKGYKPMGATSPYPASLCVSVNDELVHAIPRAGTVLKEGDVVGLDIGMRWSGLVTDMAVTMGIDEVSRDAERLIRVTKEALDAGIKVVGMGVRLGDVSHEIEKHLKKGKLGVIRDLAGHGVGYELHEDPLVPNFGNAGTGIGLKAGMVIAIEPMATLGGWKVVLGGDGWTFRTLDGSLAAHFEHTVAVTNYGAEILTEI